MLKIRLQRVGRKNVPTFRVVLTDSKNSTKSGKSKEVLGYFDPVKNERRIDADRVKYWMSVGAKPSETLHNFLVDQKIIEGKKINVLPKKKPIVKEEEEKKEEAKLAKQAPVEADVPALEEAKEEVKDEPQDKPKEEVKEEPKSEEVAEEKKEETPEAKEEGKE